MESPPPSDGELHERVRQQEVVAELGQRALETDDVDRLAADVATAVAETLDGEACAVLELLPGGAELSVRSSVGVDAAAVDGAAASAADGTLVGRALRSEGPVVVDDLAGDDLASPAVFRSEDDGPGAGLASAQGSGGSAICVAIGSVDDPWGTLAIRGKDERAFADHDATFVRSVANVLAAGIERAQKEQRLREREAHLERYREYTDEILNAADDLIYVVDETGQFQRWNDAMTAVTGYSDAEIASMDPLEFVAEDDRETIANGIAEIFETGGARVEADVLTKGGERLPYEFVAVRLEDPDGRPVLAGIGRDVRDRKAHERELARYETIVETITDGIFVRDADGRFVTVNRAYAELTGYDREELVGEPISLVVDEDELERSRERQDVDGDLPTVETHLETADGERVPVEGTLARLPADEGEEPHVVGVVRDVTERRRRERERRRVVRALEAAREGISLLDADGEFIYVNDAYAETFGYEPGEMVGEHWDDLGIEADPELFYDDVLPNIAETGQWTGTTTCVRSDGTTFRGEHSLTHTEDGELICVVRDVTEQREREADLREARAHLEAATEAGSVGLWTWDVEADVVTTDEFLAESYGIDPETAAAGLPMEAFYEPIHEDDREQTWAQLQRAVEETGELEAEYRVRDADGEISWVVARGEVEYDEDGEPVRVDGAISDITERKERERALEESERRYRTLAEHFPNGAVGVYDDDLRYELTVGSVIGEVLPPADELEGNTVGDVFPERITAELEPMLRAAIEDGETGDESMEFAGRHWRVWATPLRDADGEIFAGLSFCQDVTDQVDRERQLEELVDRLEESNERLEQFAYAASHDLQEPLRMVSSYLQLIERRYGDELDADGEEFLEYAVDGADRMRDMIQGLLAYSRVETRGDPFEPVDLETVLEDVREDLQFAIAERDAEVTVDSLPVVVGDPGQLRQLFQNLVDNGLRYSGDEPPRVHVSAERVEELDAGDGPSDGGAARTTMGDVLPDAASEGAGANAEHRGSTGAWAVSVRDEGVGIDPAEQERVFEVFQRLHGAAEEGGTGIGLALCERIVERHGGEIRVDSEPGEGATFTVTLPAAGEDA